jgi:hypothetical protein
MGQASKAPRRLSWRGDWQSGFTKPYIRFTKPYILIANGKAEHFIQTTLRE